MVRISRLIFSAIIILGCFFLLTGVASAGDAVSFSGVVKKVSLGKNKAVSYTHLTLPTIYSV